MTNEDSGPPDTEDWLAEWRDAPVQSAAELLAARVAKLERIAKAGNRIGVIDAFALCAETRVPLPLWVEDGIRELIAAALQPEGGKHRKAVQKWLKQYRGDMRDLSRYELVEQGNKELGIGLFDDDVYRAAAYVARNSDGASSAAFRASHKAVKRTQTSNPFRYAVSVRMRLPEHKVATRQRGEDELTSPDELSRLLDIGEARKGKKRAGKLP